LKCVNVFCRPAAYLYRTIFLLFGADPMKRITLRPHVRWQRAIIVFVAATALPLCAAQAQWRGGGWHGGGWGWRGPGWGWGGLSLGLAVPPLYFGWPYYYPPAAYYPPPYAYPPPAYYPPAYPYPYGYRPNAYTPGYYGYANPPTPYPGAQAYARQGYQPPTALDPNNCGTPDEPRPCTRR
jgi:hypothetical protein